LGPLDFVVLTAQSGPECLTLSEGVKPDLFLIDISMPGMNGWQLVLKLREAGQTAPLIMLSANIGDGSMAGAGEDNHNDAIAKPVDIRQLCDKLAVHLGLTWIYDTDAPPQEPPAPTEIKTPGASHIQDLQRLGEIGYIRGIETKLADLSRNADNLAFTAELATYVQAFDMAGYAAFLSGFEDHNTTQKERQP
jgi:CheY-like chemotaxis protein